MKWIKFLSSYTVINQSNGTGFGLGSKANLDGLVACTVENSVIEDLPDQ